MTAIPTADQSEEFELVKLSDGRNLAWLEWGDPDGFPVFYFHGTPSSRLEAAFAHEPAQKRGFRLIAMDRPGYGRSDFQCDRSFSDWPKDVLELADHLDVNTFGVVGHSGAGPHLFACGVLMDPARLKFIGGLAPFGPSAAPEIMDSFSAIDRFYAKMSRRMPWLMRGAFAPIGWAAKYTPGLFFKMMERAVSPADKKAMQNEAMMTAFRQTEREAFRQGGRGAAHEALIAYTPWDFALADIKVPTYIWLGDEDLFVPVAMGQHLERSIPDVDFHWLEGQGQFAIEYWHDILLACRKTLEALGDDI